MIKVIELRKSNIARLTDREPFILPNKYELEFKSIGYDISNAFVSLKNGTKKCLYPLTNPFLVPDSVLFAGTLEIGVKAYKNGEVIKEWGCIPVKIKETEHGVMCFDYLAELEERILKLEENQTTKADHNILVVAHNDLAEKHNELTETVKEIKEKFKEI